MEVFRPYGFDKPLFLVVLGLLGAGLVMVFSSSAVLAAEAYNSSFYFIIQQGIGAGLGLLFILFILSIRKAFYQNPLFIFGLLLSSFFLLALCLTMPTFSGANRWIYFFGISFQPSELAKISLILFFAFYIDKKKELIQNVKNFLLPMGILFLFILLIIKEPDYGTALLVFIICSIMLFIGGFRLSYFLSLAILSIITFGFYLIQAEYRIERILAFLSPTEDPLGRGFQVIQSKLAVGAGGLLGVSIGESVQKLYFLPCAHTDYIFAIIGEELGLLGTMGILTLFILFLWRGLVISLRAPNSFSQLLAAGLTLAVFVQAVFNISIVLGLAPPTGLPLPFISYGRSSLVMTLFAVGILLHISQRRTNLKEKA